MKRLFRLALAGLLLLGVFSSPAAADRDTVKVWTQNLYLGADLTPLVTATSYDEFFAAAEDALTQIALNNFFLRAQRLATEIAFTQPDLVGLQEVLDFTVNGENSGPPFLNYLNVMLAALAARGQSYVVAATVKNLDIEIPIDVTGDMNPESVRVLDRDVILARQGVDFEPLSGNYSEADGLCGVPIPNPAPVPPFPATLESRESEDGCNYTVSARVDGTPIGTVIVERGFVGIEATVRGKTYRFVNTHLEERQPDPYNPNSAIIQYLQSVELVGSLRETTPSGRTLILVGDFNSSPEDFPIATIFTPYQIIVGEPFAFADVWDTNPLRLIDPNGFTCCQEGDLANRTSLLDERIDLIFVRDTAFLPWAFVTGRVPIFPLWLPPNWSSDHGGVFARIVFSRPRWTHRSAKR